MFGCLSHGEQFALTDFRLYLPEEWAADPLRYDKAKVPEDQRQYKPKWELALDMVRTARANGVRFGWVGADSLYGHNNKFLNALEDDGEYFMADVGKDFHVWTDCPVLAIPARAGSGRGRVPGRLQLDPKRNKAGRVRVDKLTKERFAKSHRVVCYRQGTKGKLCARVWVVDVWVWDASWAQGPRQRRLVVSQDESGDFKYSLTNLPSTLSWTTLANRQGQRFWVEHAFHEAKSQLGMAQYQVRVWPGWHHHMALVALATLFMLRERLRCKESHPLLSYRDLTELLDYYLPRRSRDEQELLAQIRKRHRARQRDLDRRRAHRNGISPPENLTK